MRRRMFANLLGAVRKVRIEELDGEPKRLRAQRDLRRREGVQEPNRSDASDEATHPTMAACAPQTAIDETTTTMKPIPPHAASRGREIGGVRKGHRRPRRIGGGGCFHAPPGRAVFARRRGGAALARRVSRRQGGQRSRVARWRARTAVPIRPSPTRPSVSPATTIIIGVT